MELHQISQSLIPNDSISTQQRVVSTPSTGEYNRESTIGSPSKETSQENGFQDSVQISFRGRELSQKSQTQETQNGFNSPDGAKTSSGEGLDAQEQAQLMKLQQRDSEVRRHEQAHLAAAGQYARGGPSFTLQKGPDGKSYAVGGEVGIDVSKESTPEATIIKMQTIRRAALAPASPSAADRKIAAQASVKEARARQEISQATQEELLQSTSNTNNPSHSQGGSDDSLVSNTSSSTPGYSTLKEKIAAYTAIANGV